MKTLAQLVQKFGIPQKRLAEILGVSPVVLNRYLQDVREPGLDSFKIINQAEVLLAQAHEDASAIPMPQPGQEEMKKLEKERDKTKEQIARLESLSEAETEMIRQARLVLAWLQLWEQSPLHPQKPWSADFLKAQKGFSTLALAGQHTERLLAFDLNQARERLGFLENLMPGSGNDE